MSYKDLYLSQYWPRTLTSNGSVSINCAKGAGIARQRIVKRQSPEEVMILHTPPLDVATPVMRLLVGSFSKKGTHIQDAPIFPLPYLLLLTRAAKTIEEDNLSAQEPFSQRPHSRGKLQEASMPVFPRESSDPEGPGWWM